MSGSTTPHFGLNPAGGWRVAGHLGRMLNANFVTLDTLLDAINSAGGAYMPITGGTIQGNMAVSGQLTTTSLNCANTTTTGELAVGAIASFVTSQTSDFAIYRNAPQRVFQWATGVTDTYDEANGVRYWDSNGVQMSLDNSGGLNISGNAFKPGGGPWNSASDDRVKRNVRSYESGLTEIRRLTPITFEYNGEGGTEVDGKTYHGLSAQRTLTVMPELVVPMRSDGRMKLLPDQLATDLGALPLALCNAVRELADWLETVEARLA